MSHRHPFNPLCPAAGAHPEDLRRRRLIQSATLGAAGLILSPSLLGSQRMVGLDGRIAPAAVSSTDQDIWNALRQVAIGAIGQIPVVGGVLAALGSLLIPAAGMSPEMLWRAYTDKQIAASLFGLVKADLEGLTAVAALYRNAVTSQDMAAIRIQSIAANTVLTAAIPRFRLTGQEVALLPLYAVAATLHLALLRDMILMSEVIGLNSAFRTQLLAQQQSAIQSYGQHVDTQVENAYAEVRRNHRPEAGSLSPLSELLMRRTQLVETCIDLRSIWPGFDAQAHPGPSEVILDREVYSGIIGVWNRVMPAADRIPDWAPPQSPLRSLQISRREVSNSELGFVGGVRMRYDNGEETTSGDLASLTSEFTLAAGDAVTQVVTHHRSIQGLVSMEVFSQAGRRHKVVGRENNFDIVHTSSVPLHRLSSIRMIGPGRASAAHASGACVLGFQLMEMTASPISLPMFDRMAPNMPPHLLEWLAD